MKEKEKEDSGFTENLEKEMNGSSTMPIENAYSNLCEYYVSKSGHTRLFTATKYGKHYILKCLKKDFLYTPIYQQALSKEFEIGLQLEHPNICHTLGLENLPNLGTTIVMEQIDGDTLESMIDKQVLTQELAHRIVNQLLDALEYMHSKQIIHRDLKPSNIMITHRGLNVKIIDFGLSDSDAFYVLKIPAGTSGYIAPEQFLDGAKAEPRTDIYSLGRVIADMARVTGDKELNRLAKVCSAQDPLCRPDCIEKLRHYPLAEARQRHLGIFLVLLIFFLVICIAFTYYFRQAKSHQESHQQEQPLNGDKDSHGDKDSQTDNQVMDYQLWK